jgi:hypothetical protein
VAIVCAQHECYAPNALVDLFQGEQQKNVDFAFLQALKTTRVDPEQGVMLIYDIVCQYISTFGSVSVNMFRLTWPLTKPLGFSTFMATRTNASFTMLHLLFQGLAL